MGQYWKCVNLDKREFLNPHKLGSGLKLWEQLANRGVGQALVILLAAQPESRGGGDLGAHKMIGRWGGDRIAFLGDYAESDDLKGVRKETDPPTEEIYGLCETRYEGTTDEEWEKTVADAEKYGGLFVDISEMVAEVIEAKLDGIFCGGGWKTWIDADVMRDSGYDIKNPKDVAKVRAMDYQEHHAMFDEHHIAEEQRRQKTRQRQERYA